MQADVGALLREQDGKQYLPVRALARKFSLVWGLWNGQQYYARRVSLSEPEAGVQVPVFMYHAVGNDCWGEEGLFVRPGDLEAQLQYLQENGYETIFFEDLSHVEQYNKPVILTFDDGYDDNYTLLLPLLEKYQMKATIFMIGALGSGQHPEPRLEPPRDGNNEADGAAQGDVLQPQCHRRGQRTRPLCRFLSERPQL